MSEYAIIRIKKTTLEKLKKYGKYGDSMADIVERIVEEFKK